MIKSIQHLRNFGIFRDYSGSGIKDFTDHNLFYGWNGSGKSTLATLFGCIGAAAPAPFSASKFAVDISNEGAQLVVTADNIENVDVNIRAFNREFVDKNIDWDNIVQSILLVDEEKIGDRKKLKELKRQQNADDEKREKKEKAITDRKNELDKFFTDVARKIKSVILALGTNDSRYRNYDKRNLAEMMSQNRANIKARVTLLDDEQAVSDLMSAIRQDQMFPIGLIGHAIDEKTIAREKTRLDELLKTSVVNETIKRLAENGDINRWVETGLVIHKGKKECEFCGNDIPEKRIKELEGHFNSEYKSFQDKIKHSKERLSSLRQEIVSFEEKFPHESKFYNEFAEEYKSARELLAKTFFALRENIAAWKKALEEKLANPFEVNLVIDSVNEEMWKHIAVINAVIRRHNQKSEKFQEEKTKALKKLELHYVTDETHNFGFYDREKKLKDREAELCEIKKIIDGRNAKIKDIEDSLSNESLGADEFNKALRTFLGRDDLTLSFNPDEKGYEIFRDGSGPVQGKLLSEGEKTAIAFVYFIIKLRENGNKIEDTIIAIDDPISSFDSNNLFHAYSFVKINCEAAKQLFVLTHNLAFFKLIRDEIILPRKGNCYVVMADNQTPRNAAIEDAKASLTQYNSEYHYIFSRLCSFKENPQLDPNECILIANLARKLLEAFFSLKFPKYRSGFREKFEVAANASDKPDNKSKERIRKFINKYSHYDSENDIECMIGESTAIIVSDIFTLIEALDKTHFEEMMEVVAQKTSLLAR